MTWDEVAARRLGRSHLLVRAAGERLCEVVSAVCGLQAQVQAAAELGIAARVDVAQDDVRAELWERRRLARLTTLRGTLHVHPADERTLWTAACRATRSWRDGVWWRELGLDEVGAAGLLDAIAEALEGRCLTRAELAEEVVARVGDWAGEPLRSGWGYLIGPAAVADRLAHGPPRRGRVTFVRADEWFGPAAAVDPAEALVEVARRYLRAYAPSTPKRFGEWFRLGPDEARAVFAALDDELARVEVEGTEAWRLAADAGEPAPNPPDGARLLPEYDCLVLGFRERDRFLPRAARAAIAAHGRGRFEGAVAVPWLLLGGVIAGTWSRRRAGRRLGIAVEPLRRLRARERRLVEAEAERVAAFAGAALELRIAG